MTNNFENAVAWIVGQLDVHVKDGAFIDQDMEPEYVYFVTHFGTAARTVRPIDALGPGEIAVRDAFAVKLIEKSSTERASHQIAGFLAAACLGTGSKMPHALKEWSINVLTGKIQEPKRTRSSKHAFRNVALLNTAQLASELFGLPLTRNDEAIRQCSACDAVAEALSRLGHHVSFRAVKELCVGTSPQSRRIQGVAERAREAIAECLNS